MSRFGDLFIVAAPSGAGKTSLVRALVKQIKHIKISISHTTRPPRPDDCEGVDYFFIDDAHFQDMINNNAFLEHAHIYGYRYGTSKDWVMKELSAGEDVILEIDWQGARQIGRIFPHAQSIFILPPSIDTLRTRLLNRNQDNSDIVQKRVEGASIEMTHYHEFDYLVVNTVFEEALQDLIHIVLARRLRVEAQIYMVKERLTELLEKH